MIEHDYQFRVAYPDTDRMGTMHHANYAKYYEQARWELFRSIGVPYKSVEDAGVMCPVISMNFKSSKRPVTTNC
ncbi:MAG: 4-hydroxybenzoyl-CoA thioesterase [Bacteroidetes bacterium]|nr:4-hydroxybenzoyl-CoA thioesterase [Bacteroidota bacterium]